MKLFYSKELTRLLTAIFFLMAVFVGGGIVEERYFKPILSQSASFMNEVRKKESKLVSDIEFVESYAEKAKKINEGIFVAGTKSGAVAATILGNVVFSLPNWQFYKDTDKILTSREMADIISSFGMRLPESEMYWRNGSVPQAIEYVQKSHPKFRSSGSKQFFVSGETRDTAMDHAFLISPFWVTPRDDSGKITGADSETERGIE